ncbi:hypothetical protein IB227_02055 [Stenotrophomonas sp. STM01]|uniref:hypothetical protein n=1 Tax=Stenotrophomonas sp. STM01 TaxID=2769278 RepID=UPI00177CAAA7|nr:hypothetical protein [Stenotrophomonas sp. STM01]MBD9534632.1 hypothetical protein [Stenotrophomonas sp. STM01]
MEELVLELPQELSGPNEALEDDLKKYLENTDGILRKVLDLDVSMINDRAVADDYEIDDIDIDGDEIQIDYRINYSIYNGCKDWNVVDDDDRSVNGVWRANTLRFVPVKHPERLAPNEEL